MPTIADVLSAKARRVVTCRKETSVHQMIDLLVAHNIGALVVTSEAGEVEGIVTERDVLRGLHLRRGALLNERVADLMTRNVRCAGSHESVDDAMQMMTRFRFRHLPVVDDGVLVGMISIGDLVNAVKEVREAEKASLLDYVFGPGAEPGDVARKRPITGAIGAAHAVENRV